MPEGCPAGFAVGSQLVRDHLSQGLLVDAQVAGRDRAVVGLVRRNHCGGTLSGGSQNSHLPVFIATSGGRKLSGFHQVVVTLDGRNGAGESSLPATADAPAVFGLLAGVRLHPVWRGWQSDRIAADEIPRAGLFVDSQVQETEAEIGPAEIETQPALAEVELAADVADHIVAQRHGTARPH